MITVTLTLKTLQSDLFTRRYTSIIPMPKMCPPAEEKKKKDLQKRLFRLSWKFRSQSRFCTVFSLDAKTEETDRQTDKQRQKDRQTDKQRLIGGICPPTPIYYRGTQPIY